jgi:PAS domain S-box-containing protein
VQFYETDDSLLDSVSDFIGAGLGSGTACIVIATSAHREGLAQRLQANNLDPSVAHAQGKYFALDATETLAQILRDESPDPTQFASIIGGTIEHAVKGQKRTRIFGEMVTLLWQQGNPMAALQLEDLWNELRYTTHPFSLFCAYPMSLFTKQTHEKLFTKVCDQHSLVIPSESYSQLSRPDEQLRAVSLFQQKALSLEAEMVECRDAEERLRISENRYRRLFEASTDGILMVDPYSGLITDANPFMIYLLGSTHEQVVNRELWQVGLMPDQPTQQAFLQRLQQDRLLRTETMTLTRKDGRSRYLEWVSTLFHANGHQVLQCNMRDITDRKALEQQREAFVGLVTHELKTPLTVLQGNIQLAQRRLTRMLSQTKQLTVEQQRWLEDIQTTLARTQQPLRVQQRLINDLLDITYIREDKVELCLAVFDLIGLVYETVQDHRAVHTDRLITLDLPEQDTIPVYADRDRIQQVLSNYLINALKFAPATKPIQVGIDPYETGTIRVWVQDQGPGLTPQQQAHIWNQHYQVSQTPVQNGWKTGLGLGLYICHQLIHRQQGEVGVESIPGQGATFWFTLPIHSA